MYIVVEVVVVAVDIPRRAAGIATFFVVRNVARRGTDPARVVVGFFIVVVAVGGGDRVVVVNNDSTCKNRNESMRRTVTSSVRRRTTVDVQVPPTLVVESGEVKRLRASMVIGLSKWRPLSVLVHCWGGTS